MYKVTEIVKQRSGLSIMVRNEVFTLAETALSLHDLKAKLQAQFPKLKSSNGRNASEYYSARIDNEWTINETLEVEYSNSKIEKIILIVYKK